MRRTKPVAAPMVARVYLRVSTDAQDLERQEAITTAAKAAGYYVAGIYREKASGARADRPELLRMIGDLQPGEVVIAEKIDRISRLPLPEAERLVASIQAKGARWPSLAWSIYPTWRRGPGASPRSCWKPCRSCFFAWPCRWPATTTRTGANASAKALSWPARPGGTRAAVLIRSAAPKLSRCASPATASTRPPSWPGTVRPR
ncbi:Putative transposon Tn552 DNA-invertase bin3 [Escherichia coli]|nr:Putative transposon Tn552 DNA-invertase bin3 [Escherichia coli]